MSKSPNSKKQTQEDEAKARLGKHATYENYYKLLHTKFGFPSFWKALLSSDLCSTKAIQELVKTAETYNRTDTYHSLYGQYLTYTMQMAIHILDMYPERENRQLLKRTLNELLEKADSYYNANDRGDEPSDVMYEFNHRYYELYDVMEQWRSASRSKSASQSGGDGDSPSPVELPGDITVSLFVRAYPMDMLHLASMNKETKKFFNDNKELIYREKITYDYSITPTWVEFEKLLAMKEATELKPHLVSSIVTTLTKSYVGDKWPYEYIDALMRIFGLYNKSKLDYPMIPVLSLLGLHILRYAAQHIRDYNLLKTSAPIKRLYSTPITEIISGIDKFPIHVRMWNGELSKYKLLLDK